MRDQLCSDLELPFVMTEDPSSFEKTLLIYLKRIKHDKGAMVNNELKKPQPRPKMGFAG
jgi:hypothetical protein